MKEKFFVEKFETSRYLSHANSDSQTSFRLRRMRRYLPYEWINLDFFHIFVAIFLKHRANLKEDFFVYFVKGVIELSVK